MADIKRTIKKYPNRRLYDTEISSYITLEDLRQLVLDGEDFVVRDARTSRDLTRSVLLQIIADHEDFGTPILSTALLTRIVRLYGDELQGFMGPYLERSLEIFLDRQHALRKELAEARNSSSELDLDALIERSTELCRTMQDTLHEAVREATRPARDTKSH